MKKIVRFEGGVKQYSETYGRGKRDAVELVQNRLCDFCGGTHRLRLHGWRLRWACEGDLAVRVELRRLYCPRTGRTVLVFPDFPVRTS